MNNIKIKKIITETIIAIVCIGLIIGVFIFLKNKTKSADYDENNANNKISLKVYYKDNELVIDEELDFTEGETLYNVLNRTHKIEYLDSLGVGKGILSIDEYSTSWYSDYFQMFVNDKYSNEGSEMLVLQDGMEIKFVWISIK